MSENNDGPVWVAVRDLDAVRVANRLGRLYLVAEPGFLGAIKAQLTPGLERLISGTVNSCLTTAPVKGIRTALPYRL